jgi:hypothetical protein
MVVGLKQKQQIEGAQRQPGRRHPHDQERQPRWSMME